MSKIDAIQARLKNRIMVEGIGRAVEAALVKRSVEAAEMVEGGYTDEEIIKKFEPDLDITGKLLEAGEEVMNIYTHGAERLN